MTVVFLVWQGPWGALLEEEANEHFKRSSEIGSLFKIWAFRVVQSR